MDISLFDLPNGITTLINPNQASGNSIYPEPTFLIAIEPILTGGDATNLGKYLTINLDGEETSVDTIQIAIGPKQQILSLYYQNKPIATLSNVFVKDFRCSNSLFQKDAGCNISLTATNMNLTDDGYDLSSPLIDLFREGDIVRISMSSSDSSLSSDESIDLFLGSINNISIEYSLNNLSIDIIVEDLLNILARSAAVQTADNQQLNNEFLNPIVAQTYNFDNLLNSLLDETIIPQAITSANSTPSIIYYRGITDGVKEIEVISGEGSAISINSSIYAFTPPTASKLDVILQTLYIYQRIFYIDNSGNFIITPLQTYFNENEDWKVTMNNIPNLITASRIKIEKNTSNVQNRTYISLLQILLQFQQSNITGSNNKANAFSVATVNNEYFPRINDYVQSGKYLQTLFAVQEINENIIQNSGLLNIARNFNNIQGLKTIIAVDGNQNYIESTSSLDPLKYFTALYAAKNLSEQLFNEMRVTMAIPTNQTYNFNLKRFRKIPLNEMVYVPSVNNKVFDGIQQFFCYGYELNYSRTEGSITTLYLTKPYTWTALWADSTEIISGTPQ